MSTNWGEQIGLFPSVKPTVSLLCLGGELLRMSHTMGKGRRFPPPLADIILSNWALLTTLLGTSLFGVCWLPFCNGGVLQVGVVQRLYVVVEN